MTKKNDWDGVLEYQLHHDGQFQAKKQGYTLTSREISEAIVNDLTIVRKICVKELSSIKDLRIKRILQALKTIEIFCDKKNVPTIRLFYEIKLKKGEPTPVPKSLRAAQGAFNFLCRCLEGSKKYGNLPDSKEIFEE